MGWNAVNSEKSMMRVICSVLLVSALCVVFTVLPALGQEGKTPTVVLDRGLCGLYIGEEYDAWRELDIDGSFRVMKGSLEAPPALPVSFIAAGFTTRWGHLAEVAALLEATDYEKLKSYIEREWGEFRDCRQRNRPGLFVTESGRPIDGPEGEICSGDVTTSESMVMRILLTEFVEEENLQLWGEEFLSGKPYSKLVVRCFGTRNTQ